MTTNFPARHFASPEQLIAAGSYVDREFGHYGYRVGICDMLSVPHVTAFEVLASDGSRFNLIVDRWCNIQRIPDGATYDDAVTMVREQSRAASAA